MSHPVFPCIEWHLFSSVSQCAITVKMNASAASKHLYSIQTMHYSSRDRKTTDFYYYYTIWKKNHHLQNVTRIKVWSVTLFCCTYLHTAISQNCTMKKLRRIISLLPRTYFTSCFVVVLVLHVSCLLFGYFNLSMFRGPFFSLPNVSLSGKAGKEP